MLVEMKIFGLAVDERTQSPILILKDKEEKRVLPIWIGSSEAFAIALAISGITPPRPLTHDLLLDVVTALGAKLSRVVISGLKESTFYALLHIERGEVETYVVDARPSDSVALALRAKCGIILSEEIETFDLEMPETELEKQLAERIRKIDPESMIGF